MFYCHRNSVCKDCKSPKRHIGCHSDCEEYLAEVAEFETIKKKIQHEREKDKDYYDFKNNNINKTKRKHGKK